MQTTENAQGLAESMNELFKEYAQKLEKLFAEVRAVRGPDPTQQHVWVRSRDFKMYDHLFSPMRSSIYMATREASQLAEQGAVNDASRLELRIRLAEVEGLVRALEGLLYAQ